MSRSLKGRAASQRANLPVGPPVGTEDAPDLAATRLSLYLRALARCEAEGRPMVASDDLASACGFKPALVRKDLARFGQFGIRGVGYEVRSLRTRITKILGLDRDLSVVIVGAGNLGMALADSRGFNAGGFRTIALFDVDRRKIGKRTRGGVPILAMRDLPAFVRQDAVDVAVLAVPTEAAQKVLDQVAAAGVRAVLNFVPVRLRSRAYMHVRSVDLRMHLEGLAYHLARTSSRARAGERARLAR